MRFVSCLFLILICASVEFPSPLHATGLYEDAPSFFATVDTARTIVIVRQAEIENVSWRASLLAGELDFRLRRRYTVRFGFEFPMVRRDQELDYGIGDMRIRASARLWGDSLNASGLFLRADLRIPTGAKSLYPFCDASLDGGAGVEARLASDAFTARGAVLYTLAGQRLSEPEYQNDNAMTAAGSLGADIPRIATLTVAAFFVWFDGGASREIFLCTLERNLSQPLVLGIDGAVETGTEGERVYDWLVSISLSYRFSPRPASASRKSDEQ